jgi:FdrA protein
VITSTAFAQVLPDRYVDSVVLMRLAQRLAALPGIADAAAVMGTDANKALLAEGGFIAPEIDAAGANDLVVAVKAADGAALAQLDELLAAPSEPGGGVPTVHTLEEALARQPGTNLAVVSTPGEYAAAEARRALERGLHVFIFSSNVTVEDELELKRIAADRGLLCMGPDCGTAIVGGVGLGFANAVRRGPVGVVGASGSGMQAVMSLLDGFGVGVSHAIGTGGRDTSDAIGGQTTFSGLSALLDDPATQVVVVLSKPPGPATAARLRQAAAVATKPVLLCFLDEGTLDEFARAAAEAAGQTVPPLADLPVPPRPEPGRRFIRGLFAGGSLAYEAELILRRAGLGAPHTILDLGSEELTRGRPHPMIDSRLRRERIAAEAADPETAVILLDVVLGYGAAADPAGDIAAAIAGVHGPLVLASVVGTERDPQVLSVQVETLRRAGAHVFPTSAAAARAAVELVS